MPVNLPDIQIAEEKRYKLKITLTNLRDMLYDAGVDIPTSSNVMVRDLGQGNNSFEVLWDTKRNMQKKAGVDT